MKENLKKLKEIINKADRILIGAGSGLSTAAKIEYSGKQFEKHFKPFIQKYGFKDLYTSGFFKYNSLEEYWRVWSNHINYSDIGREATKLYKDIYNLVKDKNYFVITSNVDNQFYKSGFDKNKIFAVQGSYSLNQCSKGCHDKVYDNTELVTDMINSIDKDLKISKELIPYCPVCGEPMEPHLRKDMNFIQNKEWYKMQENYDKFIEESKTKNVVLLEFGVGFNTPGIIRYPFELMTYQNDNWFLVRFNKNYPIIPNEIKHKSMEIGEDIQEIITKLNEEKC